MKYRETFVANSSSTSFVVVGIKYNSLEEFNLALHNLQNRYKQVSDAYLLSHHDPEYWLKEKKGMYYNEFEKYIGIIVNYHSEELCQWISLEDITTIYTQLQEETQLSGKCVVYARSECN
jgi:hypothetical protein